ncbi:MAG: hypothetical protein AAFR32_02915 [Pseudomonadota bacterium]
MAIGVIANSKSALAFAGGVLVSAALIAMSMGSQFTPKPQDEDYAEEEVESSEEATERAPSRAREAKPVVFGDFGDDTDLIDDTGGFDPTPSEEPMVIVPTDVDDDGNWASDESSVVSAPDAQPRAVSSAQQRQIELNRYTPTKPTSAGYNSRPDPERGENEG